MQQEKDMQPPLQDEREGLSIDQIEGNPQGWDLEDISNEASLKETDEIQREALRGDAGSRDIAGSSASEDTPQGREETKNDTQGKANANG